MIGRTSCQNSRCRSNRRFRTFLDVGFIMLIQHLTWLSNIVQEEWQIHYCIDFRSLKKAYPKDESLLLNIDMLIDAITIH